MPRAGSIGAGKLDQRRCGCIVQYSFGLFRSKALYFGRNIHRTEFGPAHGAEVGVFKAFFRKCFVVHGTGRIGIEREFELAVPVETIARAGKFVVAVTSARAMASD